MRLLINALGALMMHINHSLIFCTHVEHSPTKTICIKYYMENTHTQTHTHMHARTHAHTHTQREKHVNTHPHIAAEIFIEDGKHWPTDFIQCHKGRQMVNRIPTG